MLFSCAESTKGNSTPSVPNSGNFHGPQGGREKVGDRTVGVPKGEEKEDLTLLDEVDFRFRTGTRERSRGCILILPVEDSRGKQH